jgi:hypothetical protein
MQIVRIGNRYRVKDCVPRVSNFWIDVDPDRNEINIPATGDIGPATVADLIRAIQYAVDLANGLISLEPAPPEALERQDWHDEVLIELRAGRKIEAIKTCRHATGLSLKDAKILVERIQASHRL